MAEQNQAPLLQTYKTPKNEQEEASAVFTAYMLFIALVLLVIWGVQVFS